MEKEQNIKYQSPSNEDWKSLRQGGKPRVYKDGDLTVVVHDYEGGSRRKIRSMKTVEEHGTVILNIKGKFIEFPIALIEDFHGIPCETESIKVGGDKYERVEKK
jgi:hypothetical protein